MWQLLRQHRQFRLLFVGSSLSTFGDTALYLTLPIWMKVLTGSNSAAAGVFLAMSVASLVDPFAGVLVDRLSRRSVLVWVSAGTGLVVALLLLVHGKGQIWLVFVVALVYGASMNMVGGARSGVLKDLIEDDDLGAANATLQTTSTGLRLLAPLVGAGLFALAGADVVILLDVATFVVAVGCFLAIRVQETPREDEPGQTFLQEATAGFGFVRRSPAVRQIITASAIAFLVLGLYESIPFALIARLGDSPSVFGVLTTTQGVGALVGGLLVARIMARLDEPRTFGLGLGLMIAATLILLVASLPVVLVGCLVMGLSLPLISVAFSTSVQRHTPARLLGRVFAAGELVVGGSQSLSVAAGVVLIALVDYRLLLVAIAVVLVPVCGFLLVRPVRAPEVEDAVTDEEEPPPPALTGPTPAVDEVRK